MKAFVFTDKALAKQAGRFVWLEIDTEKAQDAPLRKKFPVQALPTFFVVDPDSERVALRWVGGATVPQLEKMLDEGRAAVAKRTPGKRGAEAALARADRLYGEGKEAEAAAAYREALQQAPAKWPRYGRAVESLLFSLYRTKAYEEAAKLAREAFPKLAKTPSAANVAATGLDCALQLPAENPLRAELVEALEANAGQVVGDTKLAVADDDRSAVYIALLDARQNAKDEAGAHDAATRWASFLEGAAERAKSAHERTVFDSHRLSAYIELEQPERALPMLEASERDLPQDYNPPARLAVAYKSMERWDEALAASDRALAKAYGPRKLGILQTRADIYTGRGDPDAARRTLEDALQLAQSLPEEQRSQATIASLQKKLDALAKR
jgi:tetratricopeptide (TPR) repeat protein